jgi:hypothetical protein
MAANTSPIYTRTANNQIAGAIIGSAANTATDGTGANMYQIFSADAAEGGYVTRIILKPVGTIAATVVRIWLCTASGTFTAGTTNTAATTASITELTIAAWTASNTVAAPVYEIPINVALEPGTKLLISFGTSTGGALTGFNPIVLGGKY